MVFLRILNLTWHSFIHSFNPQILIKSFLYESPSVLGTGEAVVDKNIDAAAAAVVVLIAW